MSRIRIATLLALSTAACTLPDRGNAKNEATASAAPPPPPTITSAAPPPDPIPSAAPVATTPPAPTPAPKPVAVAAKPAATGQACRTTFTTKCTQVCNAKVNEQTTDPNKRRIEHDICLGECARASVKQCGNGP